MFYLDTRPYCELLVIIPEPVFWSGGNGREMKPGGLKTSRYRFVIIHVTLVPTGHSPLNISPSSCEMIYFYLIQYKWISLKIQKIATVSSRCWNFLQNKLIIHQPKLLRKPYFNITIFFMNGVMMLIFEPILLHILITLQFSGWVRAGGGGRELARKPWIIKIFILFPKLFNFLFLFTNNEDYCYFTNLVSLLQNK